MAARAFILGFSLCASAGARAESVPEYVSSREDILERVAVKAFATREESPGNRGVTVGVTHVGGKYHLTGKPFLIEGAEMISGMNFPGLKLWLAKPREGYPFHSDWSTLGSHPTLLEMIRHPYYQGALGLPFQVIALEVQDVRVPGKAGTPKHSVDPGSDFSEDERQVRELAAYLLAQYKDRDVTFIIQNWEGDWMFRGGEREAWEAGTYPELAQRVDAFTRWFAARQRGVDAARAAAPASKARVLHAIEVNRVLDSWKSIPTITSEVLPHVSVDLVSWSCYDGLQSWKKSAEQTAVGITRGIETIRHLARKRTDGKPVPVMLGEIGVPERTGKFDEHSVAAVYDGALAASVKLDVPYVFLWELYCNEVSDGQPKGSQAYTEDQLNGFWLVKPDGKPGFTGKYFGRGGSRR